MTANFTHAFDPKTIDTMKNLELNHILGQDGAPKYSTSQMKGKTKAQLQDEALTEWTSWLAENPAKKARKAGAAIGEGKGASTKVSKNVDCAASKKCNLLKAIRFGKKTVERATEIYAEDNVLQAYWPADKFTADVAAALRGESPKPAKMVQLTIDL